MVTYIVTRGARFLRPFLRRRRRSFLLGGVVGMVMHFLLNLPIYLASINVFGLGENWKPLLMLWVLLFVVLGVFLVLALSRRPPAASRGQVTEQP